MQLSAIVCRRGDGCQLYSCVFEGHSPYFTLLLEKSRHASAESHQIDAPDSGTGLQDVASPNLWRKQSIEVDLG